MSALDLAALGLAEAGARLIALDPDRIAAAGVVALFLAIIIDLVRQGPPNTGD